MTLTEMKSIVDTLQMRLGEKFNTITIGERMCFLLPDGRIIAVGYMTPYRAVVVEYADNADEAKLNRFEDGDLFYVEKMTIDEVFSAMLQEMEL